jgi:hypothetical protein
MPIVTAEAWLDFTLARYSTEIEDIAWRDATLTFRLRQQGQPHDLTVAVPSWDRGVQRAMVNGSEQQVRVELLFGHEFALLHLQQAQQEQHVQMDFASP